MPFRHEDNVWCEFWIFVESLDTFHNVSEVHVKSFSGNNNLLAAKLRATISRQHHLQFHRCSVIDGSRELGDFGKSLIGMFDNNIEMLNGIYAKGPHVYHSLMARKYKAQCG